MNNKKLGNFYNNNNKLSLNNAYLLKNDYYYLN